MAADNSKGSAKPKGKPRGKPFPKGVSPNPGGKSAEREELRRYLRESSGRPAIDGIRAMAGLVPGKHAAKNEKVKLDAYKWLGEQSIGKAVQAISGPDGEKLSLFDLSGLTTEQLTQLEAIRGAIKVKP